MSLWNGILGQRPNTSQPRATPWVHASKKDHSPNGAP